MESEALREARADLEAFQSGPIARELREPCSGEPTELHRRIRAMLQVRVATLSNPPCA